MTNPPAPRDPSLDATRLASGAAPRQPPAAGQAPQQLGGYRLLRRIGGGGMGSIYLGVQESVGRQVAIKVLPPSAFENPEAVERFEREVQVLGRLSHPGICPVLEAGVEGTTRFCVMEYLRGFDLARVIREQRLDPRRAAAIAAQVARALQYAHERGIVHRDIKPLNVMVQRGDRPREDRAPARAASSRFSLVVKKLLGRASGVAPAAPGAAATVAEAPADAAAPSPDWADKAVLIDFGLAREGGAGGSALTVTGAVVGTPAYMAPEQARGDRRAISAATDIYSLGATLYEMLALRAPFEGETVGEVLQQVMNADPAPVRAHAPDVDRDLDTIVQKAMEKEPGRRYATAAEMADDLERWLAGEPIRARRAGLLYRVRKRAARNPLAAAALVAAAALLAAGAWLALAPGDIELLGDLEGARVTLDGRPREGRRLRVWPPGTVRLSITREGCREFFSEFEVKARSSVPVHFSLPSTTGLLRVESEPAGAEVWCDGVLLGRAPVAARVAAGRRAVTLRLAEHEAYEAVVDVEAGAEAPLGRQLRHETGFLTVRSEPAELALDLVHEGTGEAVATAAPAVRFELKTGRWRGLARTVNHVSRPFRFEVRRGEETVAGVTLPPMAQWVHTADPGGIQTWVARDVNGDRYPDVVVVSGSPARVRAIDGRTGVLLWVNAGHPVPTSVYTLSIDVADLDGDLRPELFYAGDQELRVYDAATGRKLRAWSVPGGRWAESHGDHDGDGLADVTLAEGPSIAVRRGADGRVLWRVPTKSPPFRAAARFNPDAVPDFVVVDGERALALDGRDGRAIWERPWPYSHQPLVADLDGDGIEDAWMHVAGERCRVLSGKDGRLMFGMEGVGGEGGGSPGAIMDIDGDGALDLVQRGEQSSEVWSGASGRRVLTLSADEPGSPHALLDLAGDARRELLFTRGNLLLGLDTVTWKQVWSFECDGICGSHPLLADFDGDGRQDIVVSSTSGAITMLAAGDIPLRWRQIRPHFYCEQIVPDADPPSRLYIQGFPCRILNPADGRVLSEKSVPRYFRATPARKNGPLSFFLDGHDIARLDADRWEIVWSHTRDMCWTRADAADLNGDGVEDAVFGDEASRRGVEAFDGRTGAVLWTSSLQRPRRAVGALAGGLYWLPARDGRIHGLEPASGKEIAVFDTGATPTSLAVSGGDLLFGTARGRFGRLRFGPGTGAPAPVWTRELAAGVTAHSPVVAGDFLAAALGGGGLALLDSRTGDLLWRRSVDQGHGGAPALRDLDGDGRPEVAIVGAGGLISVHRGADGAVAWSWDLRVDCGWTVPVWCDLDGDGPPELLVVTRAGRACALDVRLAATPLLHIPRGGRRPALESDAPRQELLRQRARDAWREGRWDLVLETAAEATSAEVSWLAALAAARLGDRDALAAHAALARTRGCRRLDAALAHASSLAGVERLEAAERAILDASVRDLLETRPERGQEGWWREAAVLAAGRAASAGDWAREILAFGAAGDVAACDAAAERARGAGADPARVHLARGRAAVLLERLDEAMEHFGRAAGGANRLPEALAELQALDDLADAATAEATAAFRAGDRARAVRSAERAVQLRPSVASNWNDLAWFLAVMQGATPEDGRRAVEAATRALELQRASGQDDPAVLAGTLDTLAAAWRAAGDIRKALQVQREALSRPLPADVESDLRGRLLMYEKEAGEGGR